MIDASLTILCGLVVAGVMRRMLGAAGTRRLFGGKGWKGLFRAWAVGTLLPVCSFGVIPIAREMHRAGVRSATILAFVLAAPHINPISLLYGLTISEWQVIVSFALGSLAIALFAGAIWDRWFARDRDDVAVPDEPMPAPGLKRLLSVFVAAARESLSPSMLYILFGLLFTGILAGSLPYGCLGRSMRHDDPASPLLMAAFAVPAYIGPLAGMMRLGLMFEHGNSSGAAFVLFELGIGVNLGLFIWLMSWFGWRRVAVWTGLILLITIGLAYGAEQTLYFAHEEAGHTHAFDEWTNPFSPGSANPQVVWVKLKERVDILEQFSLGGMVLLLLTGLILNQADRKRQLEAWLTRAAPQNDLPPSVWNRHVPGPVLGAIALVGLIVMSVFGLYIYYPSAQDTFELIKSTRTEALSAVNSGNKEEAIRQLELWDLLSRKLQVGVFIRTGKLEKEQSDAVDELRERLEELRDELRRIDKLEKLDHQPASIKEMLHKIETAYKEVRRTYPVDP
jgi:uncharacterized membrane protein YraQ (UPF0718 family)